MNWAVAIKLQPSTTLTVVSLSTQNMRTCQGEIIVEEQGWKWLHGVVEDYPWGEGLNCIRRLGDLVAAAKEVPDAKVAEDEILAREEATAAPLRTTATPAQAHAVRPRLGSP